MKELSVNKLENLEGGKFWGWGEEKCTTKISGGCKTITCYKTYRIFWIGTKTKLSKFEVNC